MFEALGRRTYRSRRWVLGLAGLFVLVAVTWGTGVFSALSQGGFEDPDSESARALTRIEAMSGGTGDVDVVAVYTDPDRTVDDTGFRNTVVQTLQDLPAAEVAGFSTYWSTGSEAFVSADRHSTFAAVTLAGVSDEEKEEAFAAVRDHLRAPGLQTELGGPSAVFSDISSQVESDIARAEALSLPIVFLLLVIVFGSLTAAAMPLVIGGLAILGAFTMLHVLTLFTDVSIFAINIVTMLGLGLAVDYALFVVSRFREELPRAATVEDALVRTMATAGRTVAFSGLTVAVSLASLLLFPQPFLQSMGFGGMAAVLVAMIGALTVLPALLGLLGHRIDALRVPRPWRRAGGSTGGVWARVAHGVMRRPLAVAGAVIALLLLLGTPFLRAEFGGVDSRVLPTGTESRVVDEKLASQFPADPSATIDVVLDGADAGTATTYVDRLRSLPGVTGAEITAGGDGAVRIAVHHDELPTSPAARDLVADIRGVHAPAGTEVLVGGESAELVDLLAGLRGTLPWMALFVGIVTLLLLFAAFGSVVLPLKALAMNVLSLGAAFGAVVWIFQDGHLSGLLDFTPTGAVEASNPILMLAIAFGLSMDYEVFLLSRIREEWDRTGDNTASVATGLARTGGIITSAALLLIVVIGAFATSGITFIKMIGVGLVIAILVDATIVRGLLVPATMRLLGTANWWAPAPLRRVWERYGFREGDGFVAEEPLRRPQLVPIILPTVDPVYVGTDVDPLYEENVPIPTPVSG
ncbi:MMPL family transporter [Sporichthya polymorpha]|uniref:MMPL family transporter n=1 Tax=Sporichthya polymorpha TaxID=35751 RepID=UPI000362B971|nr:MMPL family transporter [Sporichthya polymorpha]